jgi:hypothetical protein
MQDMDVKETNMRIRYGSYEFFVMSFGLCNTLSTFTTLVNLIFHKKLNEIIIIYIDDILVYSKFIEEHASHLEFLLQMFKENSYMLIKQRTNLQVRKWTFWDMCCLEKGLRPNLGKLSQLKNDKVWFEQKGLSRS